MTTEQLDEIERMAEADMSEPWSEAESAYVMALQRYALPLVKALREARSLQAHWAADADAKEALLQSVARVCRGAKEPDESDLSVLGSVLRERDEALAEVERLRDALYCMRHDSDCCGVYLHGCSGCKAEKAVEESRERLP